MEGDNINVNENFQIFIIDGGNVLLYIYSTILFTNFYSVIIYKACFEKLKQTKSDSENHSRHQWYHVHSISDNPVHGTVHTKYVC